MKKIITLFVAALCTISAWAYDFKVGDLYYRIIKEESMMPVVEPTAGAVTIVWCPVGFTPCIDNQLVFAGSYNDWNVSDPINMAHFEAMEGAYGWYKAVINPGDYSDSYLVLSGKPCALSTDGTFPSGWGHQWLNVEDGDCEVLAGDAFIEMEYDIESRLTVTSNSSVVYIRSYGFKVDPCFEPETYTVNFKAIAPALAADQTVYVVGDFNSWTTDANPMTYSNGVWTATVEGVDLGNGYRYVVNATWDHIELVAKEEGADCAAAISNRLVNDVEMVDVIANFKDITAKECEHNYMPARYTASAESSHFVEVTYNDGTGYWNYPYLTTALIPETVTYNDITYDVIGVSARAFYNCSSLKSVTIPNSVTSIGYNAFLGCSALTSVTLLSEIPPILGANVFSSATRSIPIYVPCGKLETYNATDGWNLFPNIQEPLAEYSITVDVNDSNKGIAKVDFNTFCEGNQISATANNGYHFVQWSDGVTDNPRTLVLTKDVVLTAEFALTVSGKCGDNLYWQYAGTTLAITGTGNMWKDIPWRLFCDSITTVDIANGATSISESAFANCKKLTKVILPASMEEVGANAFANCSRLYDIYSYATLPPLAELSSFVNYNADVHVICEAKDYYKKDMTWGEFANIVCVSSDKVSTDDIVINPGSTDVTITWPTAPNAETYVIVIKQGDKVFCTLTFNKDGMLLNIAFAPSRSGSHPVTYAASTGNGLRFTVTSLEESTTYGYDITTKDEKDITLSTYTGEFTTKSNVSTSVSDIQSPMTDCQKLLRNGQLIILRDGVEYNAQGQML